jgi:hypothetical protein
MNFIVQTLQHCSKVERLPDLQGKRMTLILVPFKASSAAGQEPAQGANPSGLNIPQSAKKADS